jgi:diguanylate cyclase (GGDEF)-like protein/PAS domain S-box-containing protein
VEEKKRGGASRRRAETLLRAQTCDMETPPADDIQRLVHELRVHQIELEVQNEELRRTQEELETARDRYLELYDFAPNGYLTIGVNGIIREANLTAARMFALERSVLLRRPFSRFVAPAYQETYFLYRKDLLTTRARRTCELKMVGEDGRDLFGRLDSVTVEDSNGRVTGWRVSLLDVTERRHAEQALVEEKERGQITLHSIGDAVITVDPAGIVEYMNPIAEALTGWGVEEARGQPLDSVFHVLDEASGERVPNSTARILHGDTAREPKPNAVLINRGGQAHAIRESASLIRSPNARVLGVVLVFQDVSEARQLSRQIAYQASHDALTALVNRREFAQRLQRVLDTARAEPSEHALCYLDLDEFKIINDTCGHVAGDELLRQVGNVLQAHVRKCDTLARLGGDEFGVLMERCSLEQAMRVAESLRQGIEGFRFVWEGKRFNIAVSIGLVPITEVSEGMSGVLRAADSACYAAKDAGRDRIHVYHPADEELARRRREMQWATRIPRALEENRFRLHFQPIRQITAPDSEKRRHYELLLRLKDEEGQVVLPSSFLAAAERHSLGPKIDRWVVRTALAYLARRPDALRHLFMCAINLSGHSLADKDFWGFVVRQLEETRVPAEKLCFEITESAAIANLTDASAFIKTLEERGCRFALDDFGSGLSSFAYLKTLPVDFVKIDGTFVKGIADNAIDLTMVRCIHEIAHVMGKQTIAEFVENEAILDKLRDLGVDYAQGYALGHPEPLI